MMPMETVRAHIHQHGFNTLYTRWIYHGKEELVETAADVVNEPVDEMVAIIHDVAGINDDDDDMTGDIQVDLLDDVQYDEFKDLLSDLESVLYPSCTKYLSLNFLVKLMHLKVLYKWANECMDAVLKLLKDAFPEGIKLPNFHYELKMKLGKLSLSYETRHVCKYDFALFRKENANL